MKKVLFIFIFIIGYYSLYAQIEDGKNRRKARLEKQAQQALKIKEMVESRKFVFIPSSVTPMSGGSIHVNYSYQVELKNDSVFSYLPYFGVAYHFDYGSTKSAFDFSQPIEAFELKNAKSGYRVTFKVSNRMDKLTFTFEISPSGYTNLSVSSYQRQTISYYGVIESAKKEKK